MPIDEREGEKSVEKPARKRRRSDLDTLLDVDISDVKARLELKPFRVRRSKGAVSRSVLFGKQSPTSEGDKPQLLSEIHGRTVPIKRTREGETLNDTRKKIIDLVKGATLDFNAAQLRSFETAISLAAIKIAARGAAATDDEATGGGESVRVPAGARPVATPAATDTVERPPAAAVYGAADDGEESTRASGSPRRADGSATVGPLGAAVEPDQSQGVAEPGDALARFRGRQRYLERPDPSESPEAFLVRVYGDPAETGMCQADLGHLDPSLYQAYRNWKAKNAPSVDLPTKKQVTDRKLQAVGAAAGRLVRSKLDPVTRDALRLRDAVARRRSRELTR